MKPHVSAITLGVNDLNRAKQSYCGLGWPIQQDYPQWVSFGLDGGSSLLCLTSPPNPRPLTPTRLASPSSHAGTASGCSRVSWQIRKLESGSQRLFQNERERSAVCSYR